MSTTSPWRLAEPDLGTICNSFDRPLEALARGETPALVIRNAYLAERCARLVARLIDEELLYDPRLPVPEKFIENAIPEGYSRVRAHYELGSR